MATFVHAVPVPEHLVGDYKDLENLAERSQSLVDKIRLAVPVVHESCIHTETLKLNSNDTAKLSIMASTIGIPTPPVLKVLGENFTLDACLVRMSEGVQLHQSLLKGVQPRLGTNDRVTALLADIDNLLIQIHKMLKMIQPSFQVPPGPLVSLHLPGDYEVQVATHITLSQLLSFGHDMNRNLRTIASEPEYS